eukprot:PhF_6_TR42146/c0_g1_i1/m.63683
MSAFREHHILRSDTTLSRSSTPNVNKIRSMHRHRASPTSLLTSPNSLLLPKVPVKSKTIDDSHDKVGYFEVWPANNRQQLVASRQGLRNSPSTTLPSNNLTRDPFVNAPKPSLLINLEMYVSDSLSQLALKYPQFISINTMANLSRNSVQRNDVVEWLSATNDPSEIPVGTSSCSHALTIFDDSYLSITDIVSCVQKATKARQEILKQLPDQCSEEDKFRRERCSVFQEAAILFSGGFKTYRTMLQWIVDEYDTYVDAILRVWKQLHTRIDSLVDELAHTQEVLAYERKMRAEEQETARARAIDFDAQMEAMRNEVMEGRTEIQNLTQAVEKQKVLRQEAEEARSVLGRKLLKTEADFVVFRESVKATPSEVEKFTDQIARLNEKYNRLTQTYEGILSENHGLRLSLDQEVRRRPRKQTQHDAGLMLNGDGPTSPTVKRKLPEINYSVYYKQIESRRKYIPANTLPRDALSPIPKDLTVIQRVRNMNIPSEKTRNVVANFMATVLSNIRTECVEPLWDVFMYCIKEILPGVNALEACHNILHDVSKDPEYAFFLDVLFERLHVNVTDRRTALIEEIRRVTSDTETRAETEDAIREILYFANPECMNHLIEIIRNVTPEDCGSIDSLLTEDSPFCQTVYNAYDISRFATTAEVLDAVIEVMDPRAGVAVGDVQSALSKVLPHLTSEVVEDYLNYVYDEPKMKLDVVLHRIQSLDLLKEKGV